MSKEHRIPIMELFGPTIQGEGALTGTISHFLRTGGCGLRCSWCDSMFAVDSKLIREHRTLMTIPEILEAIGQLPQAPWITFTGGDPCLHKHLGSFIHTLNVMGMSVAVETQGQLFPDWLSDADLITFSPKGPSSGNIVNPQDLIEWLTTISPRGKFPFRVCIKIVCFSTQDFDYACQVYQKIPEYFYNSFYITAGTPTIDGLSDELIAKNAGLVDARRIDDILTNQLAIAEQMLPLAGNFNHKVHLGCQQHVLLWPSEDKGV